MNLRPDPFLAVAYEDILDAVGIVLYRLVALQMKVTYCLIGALMNARSIQVTRPSSDSGTTAYRRGPGRNPVGACLARPRAFRLTFPSASLMVPNLSADLPGTKLKAVASRLFARQSLRVGLVEVQAVNNLTAHFYCL